MAKQEKGRDEQGRFKKGVSGNPAGRAGSEIGKLRQGIADNLPRIIDKMVALALQGDTAAAKLLLERAIPPLRGESVAFVMADLENAKTLSEKGEAVINAAARGELPASVAADLLTALGRHGRLVELDELERRLAALEARNG